MQESKINRVPYDLAVHDHEEDSSTKNILENFRI
jgi:hypothetical protein